MTRALAFVLFMSLVVLTAATPGCPAGFQEVLFVNGSNMDTTTVLSGGTTMSRSPAGTIYETRTPSLSVPNLAEDQMIYFAQELIIGSPEGFNNPWDGFPDPLLIRYQQESSAFVKMLHTPFANRDTVIEQCFPVIDTSGACTGLTLLPGGSGADVTDYFTPQGDLYTFEFTVPLNRTEFNVEWDAQTNSYVFPFLHMVG